MYQLPDTESRETYKLKDTDVQVYIDNALKPQAE